MALDLRIGSGKYRGKRLLSPASAQTHPMGAREKLALFNMIPVSGAKVADLYAGTGALGIEALSRDATEVVFVEKDPKISRIIRQNLQSLPDYATLKTQVFTESVAKFTARPEFSAHFDVIFADPPYDKVDVAAISAIKKLLAADGILVLSSPSSVTAPELKAQTADSATLELCDSRVYAGARLSVYRKV